MTAPVGGHFPVAQGVRVRRAGLDDTDVVQIRGLSITSSCRTWFDLARHLRLSDGVAAVDWALHQARLTLADLRAYIRGHPRM